MRVIALKVRILPQTLNSHSLMDRTVDYESADPRSIPGESVKKSVFGKKIGFFDLG